MSFADPTKAMERLNWRATKDLYQMCKDAWGWGSRNNPNGYISIKDRTGDNT